jgi:hypothetical protein
MLSLFVTKNPGYILTPENKKKLECAGFLALARPVALLQLMKLKIE